MCIFCSPDDTPLSSLSDDQVLAAERCPNLRQRVPATIITGFLGAGKTTLVNWLLQGTHGRRFCVLQNEFGAVPVDDALIVRSERFADVAVVMMPTGCVCCKVRGDLVEGLQSLAKGALAVSGHFDGVFVETSGLSEAGPVVQTFFADRFVQRNFRLDAVVTVVDAQTAPAALRLLAHSVDEEECSGAIDDGDDSSDVSSSSSSDGDAGGGGSNGEDEDEDEDEEESDRRLRTAAGRLLCEQLCLADVILNHTARVLPTRRAQVADVGSLLNQHAFSLQRALAVDARFLEDRENSNGARESAPAAAAPGSAAPGSAAFAFARRPPSRPPPPMPRLAAEWETAAASHVHALFGSVGLEAACDLDELSFHDWIEGVFAQYGKRLYRCKGYPSLSRQCYG